MKVIQVIVTQAKQPGGIHRGTVAVVVDPC